MARKTLTVQPIVRTGLSASYSAFTILSGAQFANEGRTILHVKNAGSATSIILTIDTPGTVDGLAIGQRSVTVVAATEEFIGPFQPGVYNQSTDVVHVDFDTAGTATITAMRI